MKTLENELTWSVSRAQLFGSCPRAYFYTYYGAWGGWEKDCDENVRLTYILKNVKSMILWAGSIVHQVIKETLTNYKATGEYPALSAMQNRATELLRSGWIESINKEWLVQPNKKVNLFELYYGDGENYGECRKLPRETTDAIKERIMNCLEGFIYSPVLKEIMAVPTQNWQTIDELDTFQIEDIKIWCAVDFAYKDANGVLHIIDWKTGSENKQTLRQQLACYAFYAIRKWNATLDKLALHGVLLRDGGRRSDYAVEQNLLDTVEQQIKASFNSMKSKLDDAEKNTATEDNFPFNPSEFNCNTCSFRRICPVF